MKNNKRPSLSFFEHEVRTPLTTLRGLTQLLSSRPELIKTTQGKKYLQILSKETERLIKLLEELFVYLKKK